MLRREILSLRSGMTDTFHRACEADRFPRGDSYSWILQIETGILELFARASVHPHRIISDAVMPERSEGSRVEHVPRDPSLRSGGRFSRWAFTSPGTWREKC